MNSFATNDRNGYIPSPPTQNLDAGEPLLTRPPHLALESCTNSVATKNAKIEDLKDSWVYRCSSHLWQFMCLDIAGNIGYLWAHVGAYFWVLLCNGSKVGLTILVSITRMHPLCDITSSLKTRSCWHAALMDTCMGIRSFSGSDWRLAKGTLR